MANWYFNRLTVFGGMKDRDRFNKCISTHIKQLPFRDSGLVSQGRGFSYYEYESRNGSHFDLLEDLFKQFPQLKFQLEYDEFCLNVRALLIIKNGEILDYKRGQMYDNDDNPIDIGLPDGWKTVNTSTREEVG